MRTSIRPVTLRRIIETIDLSIKDGYVNSSALAAKLKTTRRRAQEILLEAERMKFLEHKNGNFTPNKNTYEFIEAFEREDWEKMHTLLFSNYSFYRKFMEAFERNMLYSSFTKSDLLKILANDSILNFNATAIDVLCDWAERLSIIQRNLYTNKYYLANNANDFTNFISFLQATYEELNLKPRPGLKQKYVEIAKLREYVCEKLKIKRETFDLLFVNIFKKSYGKMELCGAPITSVTKKNPFSLKKVKKGLKDSILSPQFICLKESKGIEIDGKEYRYVAIFEPLKG
ncbi:MAG: hypothetical protein QXX08_08220 [Candidatus Bathyarchaeia archaeon]